MYLSARDANQSVPVGQCSQCRQTSCQTGKTTTWTLVGPVPPRRLSGWHTDTQFRCESYSMLVVVSRFCHSNGPHEWMANGRSICRGNRQSNVRISSSGWNVVIWLECMGIMDRHFGFQFIIDGWFWAFRPSRHLTDHQTFSLRCGKWMKRRSNKYLNIIQDLQ